MAKSTEEKMLELADIVPEEQIPSVFQKLKDRFSKRQAAYQEKLQEAANNAQLNLDRINGNNA